jgi:aminomethyltransferase
MRIRATPFHSRAASANLANAWEPRGGWTSSSFYDDANAEALAVRHTAVMADISWRWRVAFEGARAEEFLSRLMTKNAAKLEPGRAFKAAWLGDKGGVRGAGVLARHGRESFRLTASAPDHDWIARAASLFDVRMREVAEEEGGLAIAGPYAAKTVAALGLDPALEPLAFRKTFWRGLDVTVSRFGELGGYELWCTADDAPLVWDRVAKAGAGFALTPAGLRAMDIIDLETGIARPVRDYAPARDGFASEPTPWELGLDSLIDTEHTGYNGRAAALAAPRARTLVGLELDGETPLPRGGQVLASLYSPALQRAIALAIVQRDAAPPPGARIVALPFLPIPAEITS